MQVPQISPTSTATALSDKSTYPTFARTIPSDSNAGPIFAEVINYFGWKRIGVVVGSDSYSLSCT
jgi:ABC-type branched-subunit amino acid transport system substrate-binding protein